LSARKGAGSDHRGDDGGARKPDAAIDKRSQPSTPPKIPDQADRAIADIRVGKRHRRDLGGVAEAAEFAA
jgi:hypothetical protein